MKSSAAFFDRIVSGMDEVLCSDDLAVLSDAERIEILRGAGDVLRRAEALVVETIASADADLGPRFGCRSTNELVHRAVCGWVGQRVLFDPAGRIVGIGSTERIFTVHQRRAIMLRDTECLIPGCHVPASWCEIHHVEEHARGGPAHTDNGVTLCWHHHRTLDTSGWEIRMDDGRPRVRGPAWWDPTRRWWDPTFRSDRTRRTA